ncbi:GNAT family N-acetyltransferase [Nocardioides aestuarii]|uniref:GNAT family N-acetyltransferase n=1 Tax=Nocardioides aestuarii TaxID=252231 RepID=A0ABW4TUS2_9ACTN
MDLELREITPDVLAELRAHVVLPPHQAEWVGGSVDDSLQEAAELPEGNPWPCGVYRDGVPVGFVMLSWDVEPHPPSLYGPWFLWKLMVAPAAQGTGVGTAVVRHLAALVKERGATELLTSCHPEGEHSPYQFYVGLGFVPTGEYAEWDEEILVLRL